MVSNTFFANIAATIRKKAEGNYLFTRIQNNVNYIFLIVVSNMVAVPLFFHGFIILHCIFGMASIMLLLYLLLRFQSTSNKARFNRITNH